MSVTLRQVEEPLPAEKSLGYASDEEYGTDPESIEKWIADFEALERPDFTDKEWDEMRRQRLEYRAWCAADAAAKEARRQAGRS